MRNKLSFLGIKISRDKVNILAYFTFFLFLVVPNALRIIKLPFLLLLLIIAYSNTKITKNQLIFFVLLAIVTQLYLLVGMNKTTNFTTASQQAWIIYVVFPVIWTIIGNFVFKFYSSDLILKKYIQLGLWGCISVYLAYTAFFLGYGEYVKVLVENPNAVITGNVFAITLNVFGSLIPIAASLGFASSLYKKGKFILLFIVYIITAAISGRSAFILSAFIGIFFFFISDKKILKNLFIIGISAILLFIILLYFNLEIKESILFFIEELTSGGGDERNEQTKLLLKGIIDTNCLGAGHGVGIDYIRNYDFPWRYENLILSIIYRVGILGFLVYAYPFIYSGYIYLNILKMKSTNLYDKFFFWGTSVFILVNFTNPYLESFEFQIPYYFTYCYFINRYHLLKNETINSNKIRV